ncbi:MAG: M1 family metallopeptidase, partial [Myxococcota bacterium]
RDLRLHIEPLRAIHSQKTFEVRVKYSAKPRIGLNFVGPDKDYPNKPISVYSQGETEKNRYWYPSYDYTNMRFTSETLFSVPKGFRAISNGRLIEKRTQGGWTTFHHKMEHPHVNYLLSVVVGEFKVYKQSWKGIPIRSFVYAEDFKHAKRSFKNTPEMMKFFSEKTGVRYPYAKYDQTVVQDFNSGGMENITATTLSRRTIHSKVEHLDYRSDGLVAHELAHQWFGDFVTCRHWHELWLNESFATYFQQLYYEHKWGKKEFFQEREGYAFARYKRSRYHRPIQTRVYRHPAHVFDAHAYPKGALVLHMIRTKLGDALWWKAINHYLKKHAHQNVETHDFRKALEQVSGQNWIPFFDQWLRRPGHPKLRVSWEYQEQSRLVKLKIKQTQMLPYQLDSSVVLTHDDGSQSRFALDIHKKDHEFTFPVPQRPLMVEFEPDANLLADIEVKKSA